MSAFGRNNPKQTLPKITKDLIRVVDRKIPFTDIKATILDYGTEYLKYVDLLDEYQGS
jgi:phenylalanyl-tRNA synthetase beta subunit